MTAPYWTPAERAGLKAMGRIARRSPFAYGDGYVVLEYHFALSIREYVAAARAVKDSALRNRVDVASLKPWTGRGRVEMLYCPLFEDTRCWGFGCSDEYADTDCYIEIQQDRED